MVAAWRVLAIGAFLSIGVGLFVSCGANDDKDDGNDSTGETLSFAGDISPILSASCSAAGCHASGANNFNPSTEAAVKAKAETVRTRLNLGSTNGLKMPPPTTTDSAGKTYTLSESDKAKIITFLDQ